MQSSQLTHPPRTMGTCCFSVIIIFIISNLYYERVGLLVFIGIYRHLRMKSSVRFQIIHKLCIIKTVAIRFQVFKEKERKNLARLSGSGESYLKSELATLVEHKDPTLCFYFHL